eukprot:NODE_2988_length_612_cov_868.989343_g2495_i0.p1 GENE.NODE_2988_length_612_cov_868.989343_g2495_i0~~NODE_2988_length_612_cov_868.989343_g2495_i0.p1  ORF type:complete len:161 (+),score=43.18 NODE_2988_length_612_cov_868.989343_g2495_i0:75-557(+)
MRKEICVFSGLPVHPGHGKRYVPTIVQSTRPVLIFATGKCRKMYMKKRNPRVIAWTVTYRKVHKKVASLETMRNRAKKAKKVLRPFAGFDLENLRNKKARTGEIRQAGKEKALKELAARKEKREAERKKKAASEKQDNKGAKAAQKQAMKSAPKQPKNRN